MTDSITPDIPRKHKWDRDNERKIPACESVDGCEHTERICIHCSLTKITVHQPNGIAYREWKHSNGKRAQFENTPPCLELEGVK